jgi:hypothetical protein
MAKLRVLLDEDIPPELKRAFPSKVQVYTVAGLGKSGAEDPDVIEEAIWRKCLIVTADEKFAPKYRNHLWRKGRDRRFFWGLVLLKHSTTMRQLDQLKLAIKKVDYKFDDILTVSSTGIVTRERLDGRDPLPEHLKKRASRK